MKKLLYSVSTALLLLSCNTEDPSLEAEPGKGGNMITFVGRTFPETRTEIGVKDGNSYPVLWSSGDRIGIISPVETLFQNASATLNASDAGKNSGIFVLETETAVESSMDLIVYYPYSSYTTYGDGALHASVPMEQRQARPGDSSHTGKYTLAYDKTTIDPAAAAPGKSPSASFSLRHAVAYVRLVISSTEYAGYKLNGASLWCDGEAVSGDISVNVATGETRTETPRNYATVVVEEPQALSSAQELWLVTLPVNLTGKEVYVSVAMTDGTKNVTIPVKVDVKELKANAVNTITVANVSPADNRFAWYQPEETRYLAEGWAYGEANTFVTSADGEEITVDVRARGFFNGCEEPKYAKIIFANNLSGTNYTLAINGKRHRTPLQERSGHGPLHRRQLRPELQQLARRGSLLPVGPPVQLLLGQHHLHGRLDQRDGPQDFGEQSGRLLQDRRRLEAQRRLVARRLDRQAHRPQGRLLGQPERHGGGRIARERHQVDLRSLPQRLDGGLPGSLQGGARRQGRRLRKEQLGTVDDLQIRRHEQGLLALQRPEMGLVGRKPEQQPERHSGRLVQFVLPRIRSLGPQRLPALLPHVAGHVERRRRPCGRHVGTLHAGHRKPLTTGIRRSARPSGRTLPGLRTKNFTAMKILKKLLWFVAAACVLSGCADDRMIYKPGSGSGNGGNGGGGEQPSGPGDYSKLTAANHPRIIMSEEDVAAIKAKLAAGSDANLKKLHECIMAYADKALTAKDLVYEVTGKRLLSVSTEAANRIISCSYAYRLTGEDKYLEKAEKDMQTVCAFKDWNSATHFLDGAEMAHGVGIGYDWLYGRLSDATKKSAEKAIRDYAFYCALNGKWNLNFYTSATNWNQVCNGGLVVAALAVYETCQDDARSIIDKAIESNASVMPEMYNPDGNYPEGYGYWGYGTAFECIMLAAMESCTGTDNGLSAVDGFKKTGKWILFMEGMNKMAFNYCDCAPSSIAFPPLWYLAHKFNDQSLLYGELMKLNDGRYTSYDSPKYFPMAIVYASKFDLNSIAPPEEKVWSGKGINPVVLVHGDWTFTDTDKFLGIKAGRANYSHGHMDVGSFVYDAWGTRWSADLGLQSYGTVENINLPGYTGGFGSYDQGAFRWAVFRYNNYNHSTITVNDALHRAGGRAKISSVINTSASKGATIDMTDILSSECESATRTVTLENDTDLVVKDIVKAKYNKAADVRWTMVTRAIPTVEGNRIVLQGASKKLYLKVTSQNNAKVTLKTWSTVGESYDASNAGYYEAGFETKVTSGQTDTFTVTLSPNE